MVRYLYTLLFMFFIGSGLEAQNLKNTMRLAGQWEVFDIWYENKMDLNLDGRYSRFAAIEYDFCDKYQALDIRLLDGKALYTTGGSPLCEQRKDKFNWHLEKKTVKIIDYFFDREVIVLTDKQNKPQCELVILDVTPEDILVYGTLPKDKSAKPAFIHLARMGAVPEITMN